ncbi:hypothetical protein PPERSA_02544 [Pseudocohnilembus persalinus]|uniref:Transmembrane protein n=1 Tax=Pseudocohnilembus persalinus TaxID=266149 RepID=A0A0V0R677_PSEPJ|nr:hypothetical protein PPERSA_02544 [Pseudocohnilembus persalinus]|eukprot:KRX09672.1 hypothetical protein PPERSA_02544 [Pseudocohnilembus persalinus]
MLNSFCTILLGVLLMFVGFYLQSIIAVYFDKQNGCNEIIQQAPVLKHILNKDLEDIYYKGLMTLCSENCPCQLNSTDFQEQLQKNTHTINQNKTLYFSEQGAKNLIECPQEVLLKLNFTQNTLNQMIPATQYEMAFNSSGYCFKFDRYIFSDINRGIPQNKILDVDKALMKNHFSGVILSVLILFIVLGCNSVCIFCLTFKNAFAYWNAAQKLDSKNFSDDDLKKVREFIRQEKEKQNASKNDKKDQKQKKDVNQDKQSQQEVQEEEEEIQESKKDK